MTDAEILAQFMEPKPDKGPFDLRPWCATSPGKWWSADPKGDLHPHLVPNEWQPRELDLDAIWEIEERLTDDQQWDYCDAVRNSLCPRPGTWDHLHVDAPTRIRALAAVLRPIVEAV